MHTQVLIVLVGILFCATTMQSRRVSHQERRILHQERHRSEYDNDHHFVEKIIPLHHEKVLPLRHEKVLPLHHQKLQHVYSELDQNRRGSDDEQQQFREQMLEVHNQYRNGHCAPPLTLDDEISNGAQQYAEYLVQIDSLVHSGADGLGENLYMAGSSDAISGDNIGRDATVDWYNEIEQYDFNQGGFSMETGHFTQVVWKSSEKLGAGMAFNNDRTKVYVVARYSPPGNYEGQYGDNVLPADC